MRSPVSDRIALPAQGSRETTGTGTGTGTACVQVISPGPGHFTAIPTGCPNKSVTVSVNLGQSRCDPDPDHISLGPGLTETVTFFWDTLKVTSNLLQGVQMIFDIRNIY